MDITRAKCNDTLVVDEDLLHVAVGGIGLEGGISLEFGTVEGHNPALLSCQMIAIERKPTNEACFLT